MIKVQFGCGGNKLASWRNHDREVDITAPLPYENSTVNFAYASHVVEHVSGPQAFGFFQECNRILTIGGVLRICVPSIEQVMQRADKAYFTWLGNSGFGEPNMRSAIMNLVVNHGHLQTFSHGTLSAMLYGAGFDNIRVCQIGDSTHEELQGLEQHGKVIGQHQDWVESICVEGEKQL